MPNKVITPEERIGLWAMEQSHTCSGAEIARNALAMFKRTSRPNVISGLALASYSLTHEAHRAKVGERATYRERVRRLVSAEALVREDTATRLSGKRAN